MSNSTTDDRTSAWAAWLDLPRLQRLRITGCLAYVALVTLLFVQPLTMLLAHALQYDLHSHIPLVPLVAGYLVYLRSGRGVPADEGRSIVGTVIAAATGIAAVTAGLAFGETLSVNDWLATMTIAYLSFVAAGAFLFLGAKWMAVAAFPIAFLIFMVPLPDRAVSWMETASVLASADVTVWFFQLTGTPLLRDGQVITLPGIVIEVAQECSGIRSSWVLLITSVLASHLFLKSTSRKVVLVAFVIPLAIVRNAIRILVIGLLAVHVGPQMIDSVIHHSGGPFFFVVSLVPLFFLLWWLRRQERRGDLQGQEP